MRNERERPTSSGRAAVVTYARMPSRVTAPNGDEPVGPILNGVEVPFVARPERADVPDVHAVAADLFGEERRPRSLRIAVLAGAVAIVAGIGVLAAAFNAAVNVPTDRPVTANAGDEAATTGVPIDVRAVGAGPSAAGEPTDAVDERLLTPDDEANDFAAVPDAAPLAIGELPSTERETASRAPAGEAAAPPAPGQAEMDRLMGEIDQILASRPSAIEPAEPYPPSPAPPIVLGPAPLTAAPTAAPGPAPLLTPVAEAPPLWTAESPPARRWRLVPPRQRPRWGAPVPPADIPDALPPAGLW